MINRLVILIITILLLYLFKLYLKKPVTLAKYHSDYAFVSGATGGLGRALCARLLQEMSVIAVGRSQSELESLQSLVPPDSKYQLIPFRFDFELQDLATFEPLFASFLLSHNISPAQIGVCFSNAGSGEFRPFHSTSLSTKLAHVRLNLTQHILVTQYFTINFKNRSHKSALIITSSVAVYISGKNTALYQSCKTGLTALGMSIYTSYKRQIDVLTVHPPAISGTKFFKGDEFAPIRSFENSKAAVSPFFIVEHIFKRLGKIQQTNVGSTAMITEIISKVGKNALGFLFSCTKVVGSK
ncbi:Reductase [Hexamita inflata]|uniref:Putative n=1 Tax=Hexamita inflata TaxID=28002 RepID=A0AA86QA64_9EUKA|nr:Reductase [Hexamita inflata]